ncbi:hypothetical protein DFH28DRAFT_1078888 [Melampsora americana]|nr:hypothetical protein DFH28DRAFT_1078888 [Melampsora americana]
MVIEAKYSRWLTEYGAMDVSAKQFIQDLEMLDAYQESITSTSSLEPQLTLFRLSGLEQIVRQHGQHSPQYRLASSTLKKFLDGILSTPTESQTILIAVPPKPAHTRLGKRTSLSLLAPFQTSESSFVSRSLLDRRSEIFAGTSPKIVSSTRACYSNVTDCEENTKTCNGHGSCVMGQRSSGGNCFICECKKEKKDGKVIGWSCEFVLISGSVIGLIIAFSMAIALLFSIGAEGLPQQLASVSGSNKKND